MKVAFTTGEAAKLCMLSQTTIRKHFDQGLIKGYHVPVSNDRRIPRDYLRKYMFESGIPLGILETRILIVAQDDKVINSIKREIPTGFEFRTMVVPSTFAAGTEATAFNPDCIIIDFAISRCEAIQFCQSKGLNDIFAKSIVIALLPDDGIPLPDNISVNWVYSKPFDATKLFQCLKKLTEEAEGAAA